MVGAYGWAFVKPIRKLYYNMTITFVSVVAALVVGGIEALGLIGDKLALQGPFWGFIGVLNDNFGALGYAIVGVLRRELGRVVRDLPGQRLRQHRGCAMIPGEMFIKDGDITLNAGRKTVTITVANSGDRPIQVGSHYHFFETNPALKFDRKKARGMRLDIAAGTAVRFEPGQTREVTLVALAGKRTIYGFRQDVMGKL